ncbi:nuclear transport factor 2 family protein [Mesorhizobium sp.]|uniref:nuclear transport factor 2 family protein n=1 Tax=Mesorhizobium sp. TaxID=1871066 RepID=UPI00257C0C2D|nr:nuclear transport factor 2 family protein [Mesorhizobium sp.]
MDERLDRRRTAMELLENMFEVEIRFLQSGSESLDMLASAFHAEVVVHEPQSLPYAGGWKGLDGVGALFRQMREIWSDVAVESLQAAQSDDTVYMSCTLPPDCPCKWCRRRTAICGTLTVLTQGSVFEEKPPHAARRGPCPRRTSWMVISALRECSSTPREIA